LRTLKGITKIILLVFFKQEPAWVTGCDFLPGIRRVVCCTERSIVIWDHRSKGKNQV